MFIARPKALSQEYLSTSKDLHISLKYNCSVVVSLTVTDSVGKLDRYILKGEYLYCLSYNYTLKTFESEQRR